MEVNHGANMISNLLESVSLWVNSLESSSLKVKELKEEINISGTYEANYYYEGLERSISDSFELVIHVYKDYPKRVPDIEECDGKIPIDFHMNGRFFCLAVPMEMTLYANSHTASRFLDKYLNSYLMSFLCYQQYGFFPNGERSHGTLGKIEHLMELFGVDSFDKVKILLDTIIKKNMSRNDACICGSGKKYKMCHREVFETLVVNIGQDELKKTHKELMDYSKE